MGGAGQIDGAALVPVIVALYWVALNRSRRIALAAGVAGAVAIFVTEGLLGPFGWFGGPNATMWPELLAAARSARTSQRAASGWPPRVTGRRVLSRPGRRKPAGASTPMIC